MKKQIEIRWLEDEEKALDDFFKKQLRELLFWSKKL